MAQLPQCVGSALLLISQPSLDIELQSANPERQLNPHDVPLHVAVELAGTAHAVQDDAPQFAVLVLLTQTPAQLWKPALQTNPHTPAVQDAVPFAGALHTVLHEPQ